MLRRFWKVDVISRTFFILWNFNVPSLSHHIVSSTPVSPTVQKHTC